MTSTLSRHSPQKRKGRQQEQNRKKKKSCAWLQGRKRGSFLPYIFRIKQKTGRKEPGKIWHCPGAKNSFPSLYIPQKGENRKKKQKKKKSFRATWYMEVHRSRRKNSFSSLHIPQERNREGNNEHKVSFSWELRRRSNLGTYIFIPDTFTVFVSYPIDWSHTIWQLLHHNILINLVLLLVLPGSLCRMVSSSWMSHSLL